MKLLLVSPYFFEPHRWVMSAYKIAHALSKRGHEIIVLTTGKPPLERKKNLTIYRLPDIFLPDPINYSIVPGLYAATKRILDRHRPDAALVVKYMFFTALVVPLLRKRRIPTVVATDTFPGYVWWPRNKVVGAVMAIYHWLIGWPLLGLADKVVVFHEGLVDAARRLRLNATVIHNGVDVEAFARAKPAQDIKKPGTIAVGYVGRLESVKGYDDFLAVAATLGGTNPNLRFYLVGTDLKNLASRYATPQIIFTGLRRDIASVMKALDIFVLPSYSEGLPNALMEAMAAGCACIASNVGGAASLIKHRKNGLLFEPGDRAALARHITTLANNRRLRVQYGRSGRRTIETAYNWSTIARSYAALFQKLIREKQP